jgi:phospholipase/carboxylesterase
MRTEFTHRFVPSPTGSSVTLLALHGTGGDENDLLPIARSINPDAAILSPRGRVLEHGMPRFFRRLAEGVFDQEDLRIRTAELAVFIAEAAAEYAFDASRVVALGYSNGANIAASLMLTRANVLAGGILLRPMVPFEPEHLPDLLGSRVLLSAGRQDPLVLPTSTERLASLLEKGGAEVTLSWYDTGHTLIPQEIAHATAWFAARFAA